MGRNIGVTFEVGAKTMGTVASTFATVESRLKNLKSSLKGMEKLHERTAALMRANDRLQAARSAYRASPNEKLKKEMDTAARAFRSAQRALRGYGVNVGNVEKYHRQLEDSINRSNAALTRQQRLQGNQARRSELRGQMFDTVALATTVAVPVKLAMDFESSFADVKKVIDFASAEEEKAVQADIRDLSAKTGLAASGIAGIYAAAGSAKLATSQAELLDFANTASTMAVAFGMSADEAGQKMASWRSKMGMSQTEVVALSDAINHLGNNMAADPLKTAEVVERMGAVAKGAGLAEKSIAALSASFVAASPSPEIAATGMKNFLLAMTKGEALTAGQKGALDQLGFGDPAQLAADMQRDAEGTILSVMESINNIPKAQQAAILSGLFGSESLGAIQPLLENLDTLKNAFRFVADEQSFAGSMSKEYASRSQTTEHSLNRLRRSVESLAIGLGTVLLPPITTVAEMSVTLLRPVIKLAEEYPEVTTAVFGVVGALAAFKVVGLAGAYAATFLSDGLTISRGVLASLHPRILLNKAAMVAYRVQCVMVRAAVIGWAIVLRGLNAAEAVHGFLISGNMRAMTVARVKTLLWAAGSKIAAGTMWLLNAAMSANPIGALIRLLMLAGAGLVYLYRNCEPVRVVIDKLWSGIKTGAAFVFDYLKTEFEIVGYIVEKVGNAWATVRGLIFGDEENSDFTISTAEEKIAAAEAEKEASGQSAKTAMSFAAVAINHTVTPGAVPQSAAMEMPTALSVDSLEVGDMSALEDMDLTAPETAMPGLGQMDMEMPDISAIQSQAAPQIQTPVTQEFNITLHGVSDKEFADRVVESIKSRSGALENVIGKIIANVMAHQKRLSYE